MRPKAASVCARRHFAALIKNALRKFNFLIDGSLRQAQKNRRQCEASVVQIATCIESPKTELNPIEIHWANLHPPPFLRACRVTCLVYISIRPAWAAVVAQPKEGAGAGTGNEYGECGKWFNLECECECECFTLHMPRA